MAWWKQLLLSLVVLGGAFLGWLAFVPSALPLLERAGLLGQVERAGVISLLDSVGLAPERESGQGGAGGGGGPPGAFGGAPTVTVAEVASGTLSAVVTAIGNGQALRSVTVTPESSGRLVEILAEPGQHVSAGTTLARLDAENERNARDRADLQVEEARDTAERFLRLQGTGAATAVQIREAERALRAAELALAQAETDLARREILAPIDGWVGFVPVEIGNQVSAATEITRIDDRSSLRIEFLVPERYVGDVAEGTPLVARPLARNGLTLEGRVRAIDNRVDPASRSLTVQAEIENPDDMLRAGMAFAIEMAFEGESYPAVDPLAIQWNRSGAFVWALREGRTARVPVRIVQRSSELVLVDGALEPGEQVVREGVQMLRPGLEVQVRGADRPDHTAGIASDS